MRRVPLRHRPLRERATHRQAVLGQQSEASFTASGGSVLALIAAYVDVVVVALFRCALGAPAGLMIGTPHEHDDHRIDRAYVM
jgi:hypothetical protein